MTDKKTSEMGSGTYFNVRILVG